MQLKFPGKGMLCCVLFLCVTEVHGYARGMISMALQLCIVYVCHDTYQC